MSVASSPGQPASGRAADGSHVAGSDAAGLDPNAIDVLRFLIGRSDAAEPAIAEALDLDHRSLRTALRALEQVQLVVRVGAPASASWVALPPRAGLTSLLARRRAELAQWEVYVDELENEYRASSDRRATTGMLEVVTGGEVVSEVYAHLLASSRDEVLHLAKPPYVESASRPAGSATYLELTPDVRMRSVYDADGFTEPVSLDTAARGTDRGAEMRLLSGVPTKLVVFDRRAALLPVVPDDPMAASMVVHAPSLVESLAGLFEELWNRAMPLALWHRIEGRAGDESLPADGLRVGGRSRDVLDLMAAGLTDDAIARALGVSRRTVQKDVSELADALGARTRFQIAMLATEKGLVSGRSTRGT
ncbi:regulatory LuxR family protein [Haloactinopolyspora alba]|uniref:Regulatory LuxR family protein n=1 Tax=Haloactinopolyspora alba TaxID=648780 RepID=A0A2P8EG21_9ACTN|nr:LuxR C-terminal-related transcriptional regulator [Haloactinopolyspora alba]PSL08411.1 regulatory LuxR family protein [Haloactinopolyspora alba]